MGGLELVLGKTAVDPVVADDATRTRRLARVDQCDIFAAKPTVVDMVVFDDVPRSTSVVDDRVTAIVQRAIPYLTPIVR